MTRQRLWQVIGFLALVALIFVVTTIRDEVRALREDRAERTDPSLLLAGTPLARELDHEPVRTPLSRAEQFNVVAVMVVSQAIQVVFFTAGLFAFFLALGIVAIPYDVAVLWSAEQTCCGGSTALCRNMVRYPHPDPADDRAHVTVRRGAFGPVLHRQHQHRPAVPAAVLRAADRRRRGEPGRPRRLPRHRARPRRTSSAAARLEVLPQIRFRVDGPRCARRLAGDQRADVDDPLALLARDPGPVIGIRGVGQVLVLGELVDDRVEQVLDAQAVLARSRAPT